MSIEKQIGFHHLLGNFLFDVVRTKKNVEVDLMNMHFMFNMIDYSDHAHRGW
jgi:hypothetical protein